jgi:hypothetical protein
MQKKIKEYFIVPLLKHLQNGKEKYIIRYNIEMKRKGAYQRLNLWYALSYFKSAAFIPHS